MSIYKFTGQIKMIKKWKKLIDILSGMTILCKRWMSDIKEEIISNTCVACSENITEEAVITESIKNHKGTKKGVKNSFSESYTPFIFMLI